MPFAIMRVEKLGSKSEATKRQKHNSRERGAALSDRDGKAYLKHLTMQGTALKENKDTKKTFAEFLKERVGEQKIRKNACFGFETILSFSPGSVPPEKLPDWASKSMGFIADVFGKENLFSAQIHLSESTPHIHVIAVAIDEKGKLNSHGIINGPAHMRKLQTEYAERMKEFGLQRGLDKHITKARHKACSRWYAEQSEKQIRLDTYEKFFGKEEDWDIDMAIDFISTKQDIEKAQEPCASEPVKTASEVDKDNER